MKLLEKYFKFIKKLAGYIFCITAVCVFIYGFNNGFGPVAVIDAAVYNIGSTGTRISQIQERLDEYGYYTGDIDGIYGQSTFDAVKRFQQNNGLVPDGIVGDATLNALGLFFGTGNVTPEERELLARIIYGEGRGEPYEGQVAIGAVVLNRVDSPDFPGTMTDVAYQSGAFDAVYDGQVWLDPDETAFKAADDALNGWDPTGGALDYWNPQTATSRWIWNIPITYTIGRHVFGK